MFSVIRDPCGCFHLICSELEETGLPRWLGGKALACNAGDSGLIPGLGRSPGKGREGRKWQPTPVLLPGGSPWTEEPGGLQSMGSQRVGHN